MYALGALVSAYWTWGFSWLGTLPPVWVVAVLLIAGFPTLPPVSSRLAKLMLRSQRKNLSATRSPSKILVVALVSAVLFALFYLLRSRSLVYGDGYLLLASVSPGGELALEAQNSLQASSLIAIRNFVSLLDNLWSVPPANSLAIFNCVGGVAGCWAIYGIA
ncbi:hypothetical protein C3F09_07895, partial [candidate division GN15 bacterium]